MKDAKFQNIQQYSQGVSLYFVDSASTPAGAKCLQKFCFLAIETRNGKL